MNNSAKGADARPQTARESAYPSGGALNTATVLRGAPNRLASFIQAIRGPILLITLGALFAIHQADVLPFSRTWPLVLIVIGLMKLFERMAIRPVHVPPSGGPYV